MWVDINLLMTVMNIICWLAIISVLWLLSSVVIDQKTFKKKVKMFLVVYFPIALIGVGVLSFMIGMVIPTLGALVEKHL